MSPGLFGDPYPAWTLIEVNPMDGTIKKVAEVAKAGRCLRPGWGREGGTHMLNVYWDVPFKIANHVCEKWHICGIKSLI